MLLGWTRREYTIEAKDVEFVCHHKLWYRDFQWITLILLWKFEIRGSGQWIAFFQCWNNIQSWLISFEECSSLEGTSDSGVPDLASDSVWGKVRNWGRWDFSIVSQREWAGSELGSHYRLWVVVNLVLLALSWLIWRNRVVKSPLWKVIFHSVMLSSAHGSCSRF